MAGEIYCKMNDVVPFLKYIKKLSLFDPAVLFSYRTFFSTYPFQSDVESTVSISYDTRKRKTEIKNKEVVRAKKQKSWLKKIHETNVIPKKFGNKLGSLAQQEYLRYVKDEQNRGEERKKWYGYLKEKTCDSTTKSYFCVSDDKKLWDVLSNAFNNNLDEHVFEEKNKTESASKRSDKRIDNSNTYLSNVKELSTETAYLNKVNKSFWDDVNNELKYHLPFLQPFSITAALNCLSKINYDDYSIFKLVAEQIDERWIKNFNIKDLTTLLLAYSRIPHEFYTFINVISRELLYKIGYADFEEITNIAYAYTKMKIYDHEVFLHLCKETKYKIKEDSCKEMNSIMEVEMKGDGKEEEAKEEEEKKEEIEKRKSNRKKKKYAYLCLLIYCLGKMRHFDMELFYSIVDYVQIDTLNNIDLSNLAYTYSVYDIYKPSFYEQFILISSERFNSFEPMQKVIILTYLLRFPGEQYLSVYNACLENIMREIKIKNVYCEPLLLNACINSFSRNSFLDFLSEMIRTRICENQVIQVIERNQLFSVFNLLTEYTIFFINHKIPISSKDFPKLLNILVKVFVIAQKHFSFFQPHLKTDPLKLECQINFLLDQIISEAKKMHIGDLQSVKNTVSSSEQVIKDKWADKIKIICDFINSSEN